MRPYGTLRAHSFAHTSLKWVFFVRGNLHVHLVFVLQRKIKGKPAAVGVNRYVDVVEASIA